MARLGLLASFVAALAACGGGGGGSAPPPPPPPPPPAPPPASVLSFTPADAATQVDVQSTLKIAFDKSLDPASVTRAHVTLVAQGVPVATKVTYDDATHAILVDPMGLNYGLSYTLSVSGLVDANGKTVADRKAAFSTWINGETSGVYLGYNELTSTVKWAWVDTFDAAGATTGNYITHDAGPDGVWGTADDVIYGGYEKFTYTSDGQIASRTSFGPGPDGLWYTADDTPTPVTTRTFLPNGALATDDSFNVIPPFGSSPEPEVFTTYVYASDGTLKTAISAIRAGADGVWGTADDLVAWSVSYTYDEFGRVVLELVAAGPGPDGIWGTADDAFTNYIHHFYLASGRLDRLEYYDNGTDHLPGTPDDVLDETDTSSYDAANNLVRLVYTYPDAVGSPYVSITYDAHGNRLTRSSYGTSGPDSIWFNADDRRDSLQTFDTTK